MSPKKSLCRLVPRLLYLAIALLASGFGPPHLIESSAAQVPVYPSQLQYLAENRPPPLEGEAALIMDAATGRVVFQRNAHQRRAPASTTKIMTAIIALERGRLDHRITIAERHLSEGSLMGLLVGDVVTVDDLLWGLLLNSGNDAALALAEAVAGSVEAFVAMMNQKAAELGLGDTHFVNPHGLDEPDHYSSAYDLAVMARYALGMPRFAQMVATESLKLETARAYYLRNTNQLLRLPDRVPGVDGVKTGLSDECGECLVASVTRHGHRVIVVVLGSEDRVEATIPLIDYAFSGFIWSAPRPPLFLRLVDDSGPERPLYLEKTPSPMLPWWQWAYLRPRVVLDLKGDPQPNRGVVGRVQYFFEKELVAEMPLVMQ